MKEVLVLQQPLIAGERKWVMELRGASHKHEFKGVTQKKAIPVNTSGLFPCPGAHLVVTTKNGVTHPCPKSKPLSRSLTKQKLHKRNVGRKPTKGNT